MHLIGEKGDVDPPSRPNSPLIIYIKTKFSDEKHAILVLDLIRQCLSAPAPIQAA